MSSSMFGRKLAYTFFAMFFASLFTSVAWSQVAGTVLSGEYIIKFKSQTSSVQSAAGKLNAVKFSAANKLAAEKGARILSALKGIDIHKKFDSLGMMHIRSVTKEKLDILKSHPDVEYVEPNTTLSIDPKIQSDGSAVTAESLGATQGASDTYSQSFANTQVTQSWSLEKSAFAASKTVVAVVDTGLDTHHAVFHDSNAVWQNVKEVNGLAGVDDDGNGYIDDMIGWNFVDDDNSIYDDNDHGTHVSGIVLGVGQDIFQVPVRESKVVIMPLKFLNGSGSGSTADAIDALYYAVNNGAQVINNSWGGPSYSRSLQDAYTYAYNHDVVIVTAAGNDGVSLDSTPTWPAAMDTPSNITVAASTSADNRASFSNYSTTYAHVFAPGTAIMSTIPGSQCTDANNLFYFCLTTMNGTSMATPFVTGLAALAIREAPQLSAYQIKSVIMTAIDPVASLASFVQSGGRVNAYKTIQVAQAQVSASAWSPAYNPVYKTESSSEASTPGKAAGCGLVKAMGEEMNQGPPSAGQLAEIFLILAMMAVPVGLVRGLRAKKFVRRYERFQVAKEVMIQIGDQVVNTASQTLAVGGLSFKSEQQFEKGQKIKLKISDVNEEIEGEIVWSTELNAFGVKFLNVTESLKNQVQGLTAGLMPT